MGVENFKKEDLVGKSLDRLLAELESISRDETVESYETLEKFIVKLSDMASDATLVVTKANGSKMMDIRGEQIDLTEKLKELVKTINDGINSNAATEAQHAARESLRKTISTTVGVLLKEDEIMQELLSRGVTKEEFIKNAEEEIRRSEEKVNTLKPLRDEKQATMDLFGKTVYLETSKSYMSKSYLDELKHDKAAAELLEKVMDKLDRLHDLQDAATKMDTTSTDYANNKKAMEELLIDVKGLAGDLKALGLRTQPVTSTGATKTSEIDFAYLEKLDIHSDFEEANDSTNEIYDHAGWYGVTDKGIKALIDLDYENIKAVMKKDFARFGFASETEVNALSHDDIDKAIAGVRAEYTKIDEEIKYEEAYQAQTKESMEKFKAKADREKELTGKFKTVKEQRPKMQADGKTPETDPATGNVIMEDYYVEVPTDDARKDYLAGQGIADEAAYKTSKLDAAKAAEEAAEARLSREAKRDLIRKSYQEPGRFQPIKWFRSQFFTNSMWENEYKRKYLSEKISDAEGKAKRDVETEIETKLKTAYAKDLEDRKVLTAEMSAVRKVYTDALIKAASQEKMTDELYRGEAEDHVKAGARRAAMNISLNYVSDAELVIARKRYDAGEITMSELKAINSAWMTTVSNRVKMDDKAHQDRAHADQLTSQNTSRKVETPTYRDER